MAHNNTAGLVPAVSNNGAPGSIGCYFFQQVNFNLIEITG
jgi:hypothetical protein